jgi:Fur family transcriptional regulator, ferric uptake regulator
MTTPTDTKNEPDGGDQAASKADSVEATAGAKGDNKGDNQGDNKEPWRAYLRRKRLKTTQQREAIVDAFLRTKGHVALEDLLAAARKRNPGVGLATVYRTVKLLEEAGLAHSRQFGSGHTLYEVAGQRAHHDHLICQQCNHIVEFENDEIEALQERVARRFGFNITRHRHEIFGLCEKAQGIPGGFCPAERVKKR